MRPAGTLTSDANRIDVGVPESDTSQGDTLITNSLALVLVIGALFDTVAADALFVVNNFVVILGPRSRKQHSTVASARTTDVQIDSRPTTPSRRRSGWARLRHVVPESG
jgi:hypothetical protein